MLFNLLKYRLGTGGPTLIGAAIGICIAIYFGLFGSLLNAGLLLAAIGAILAFTWQRQKRTRRDELAYMANRRKRDISIMLVPVLRLLHEAMGYSHWDFHAWKVGYCARLVEKDSLWDIRAIHSKSVDGILSALTEEEADRLSIDDVRVVLQKKLEEKIKILGNTTTSEI